MGLFGGKKPGPICGTPAGRFLATKVEGQALCGSCGEKADCLPGGVKDNTTVEKIREFIAFYDQNAPLRDTFEETCQYDLGFLSGSISIDVPHKLLRLGGGKKSVVFEAEHIRSFRISEDEAPLFEGSRTELVCYQSAIPEKVRALGPEIRRYQMEKQQYEQMERMDRMMEEQAKKNGEFYSKQYYTEPDINLLKPFQEFRLRFGLDEPSCDGAEFAKGAPDFFSFDPSITSYLRDYGKQTEMLRQLAVQLMVLLNPDAPERQAAAQAAPGIRLLPTVPSAPAAPVDAVAEIQKYKGLLDSGVITEEEFAAKKRQLLGI